MELILIVENVVHFVILLQYVGCHGCRLRRDTVSMVLTKHIERELDLRRRRHSMNVVIANFTFAIVRGPMQGREICGRNVSVSLANRSS